MKDVVIIGGGLSGLALAHSLHARRIDWALFEARPRLGGRVLTRHAGKGLALDLGPTWFWPATQPSMARLVADLGLATIEQADDGRVLLLDDPNRAPRALAFDTGSGGLAESAAATPGAVHGGACRLAGGMAALTDALVASLPLPRLHLGQPVARVVDAGDHVALHLRSGESVSARRVVFALPPRLVAERIHFAPTLAPVLLQALQAAPTWMASAAKAVVACAGAPWRALPGLGNTWATHPQAVLAETFDVGSAEQPAIGGFVALGVAARQPFRNTLPLLVQSQVGMLFGPAAGSGEAHLQDWADEAWTCSAQDRAEDAGVHPNYGDESLQQGHWNGRLWFGGSETARHGGGYLEGALGAAARLRRQLTASA